jgi:hypothetical protein
MPKQRKNRFSSMAPSPKPATNTAGLAVPLQSSARRSSGKRTDPRYKQMTAYVGVETHQRVKEALIQDRQGQEISELVDELLLEWLNKRKK